MADSKSKTQTKISDADLAFLGEAVKAITVSRSPVKPGATRERQPNPFEATVKASYDTPWTDEEGTEHEHGEPRQTGPLTANQKDVVMRALTRAGRHLSLSVPRQVVPAYEDGRRVPNKVVIVYAGAALRKRNKPAATSDNGEATLLFVGAHNHDDMDVHDHPESNPHHAHAQTDMGAGPMFQASESEGEQGGEQDNQPEGEQDDQNEQPEGEREPVNAW